MSLIDFKGTADPLRFSKGKTAIEAAGAPPGGFLFSPDTAVCFARRRNRRVSSSRLQAPQAARQKSAKPEQNSRQSYDSCLLSSALFPDTSWQVDQRENAKNYLKSLVMSSSTAFSVIVSMGCPPPPKRRSVVVMPPFVEEDDQTTLPLSVSTIWALTDITFAMAVPDLTSPYSLTVPVMTAWALRMTAQLYDFFRRRGSGRYNLPLCNPPRDLPHGKHIEGARCEEPVDEAHPSPFRQPCSPGVKLTKGITATVWIAPKSILSSRKMSA